MLTVADVMTRDVITIAPDTPVQAVAMLLYERHISGAPVVDAGGQMVGILSEGDLMTHTAALGEAAQPRSWWLRLFSDRTSRAEDYLKTHGLTAADVMTKDPLTVAPTASLAEVARLLERHRFKRLPVVENGRLVGIVSRANLLRGLVTAEAPGEVTADDRDIATRLRAALDAETLGGGLVNPIVQDGTVHLWGLVDNDTERRALILLAQRTPGVKAVEDHLGKRPAMRG
jgi:CBS domain-containing protein